MASWTESQIIEDIQVVFPTRDDLVSRGIGDDCAVMRQSHDLVTTDASIENVHFRLDWMTPADAAYRCLTSNISDIAAMGGQPGPFTLALGLPKSMPFDDVHGIITALRTCIEDHDLSHCWLIGGDVVRSQTLMFSITMFGSCPGYAPVMRNGARPGDDILVLGSPGLSHIGLSILARASDNACVPGANQTNARRDCTSQITADQAFNIFLQAFRRPIALPSIATEIARQALATAMMDLSDGIRTDLPRLLAQSGCGARVDIDALVPTAEMREAAASCGLDPVSAMLCGGEDFGLLLTSPPQHSDAIRHLALHFGTPCRKIGKCTRASLEWFESGLPSDRKDTSFTHFGERNT